MEKPVSSFGTDRSPSKTRDRCETQSETWVQTEDVNCAPLSEVKVAGTPNLNIQAEIKALTQVSVEIEDKGTASGQGVVLSIIVRI